MVNFVWDVCSVVSGFLVSCEGIVSVSTIFMLYVVLAGALQKNGK